MNIKNKVLTGAICATVLFGGTVSLANTNDLEFKDFSQVQWIQEEGDVNISCEKLSFDTIKDLLKDNLNSSEKKDIKNIIEDVNELDEKGKFDDADKVWEKLNKYMDITIEEINIGDIKEYLKKDIKDSDKKDIQKIIDNINELEKREKYEEVDKEWEKLNKYMHISVEEVKIDDIKEYLKKDLKDSDKKDIQKIIDNINELDKKGKYEEFEKEWAKLDKYMSEKIEEEFSEDEKTFDVCEEFKMSDIKEYLKDGLLKKDLDKIQKILDNINEYDKKGEYEKADKECELLEEYMIN